MRDDPICKDANFRKVRDLSRDLLPINREVKTKVGFELDRVMIYPNEQSTQNTVLRLLLDRLAFTKFEPTKKTAIHLNEIVATNEALKVGAFRDNQDGIRGTAPLLMNTPVGIH